MNSAQKLITIMTLASETSTATWAVLMVVVGFISAGIIAAWRMYSAKVGKVEDQLKVAEDKVSDTRHSELKTLISSVKDSVHEVGGRVDHLDKRVGHLEKGHAEIKAQLSAKNGGERA